jgi:large repetitive protein
LDCNGIINIDIAGGTTAYSIEWFKDGSPTVYSTSEDLTGLGAGSYVVVVTDANFCSTTTSTIITEPAILTVAIAAGTTTGLDCNGDTDGNINIDIAGGTTAYSIEWFKDGSPTVYSTSEDLTGLTAGSYEVVVTDANGCTTTASATIGVNQLLP